jgi:4'-phosphopantetheinyl transferase
MQPARAPTIVCSTLTAPDWIRKALNRAAPLPLAPGQVDIWLTSLASVGDELQLAYQPLLSAAEHERWRRFLVEGARLQHLVARALVRTTLSRYAAVPEDAWEFEPNCYGRPYVSQPTAFRDLHFNLSHTDGLVVCAVSRSSDIGVDVENIQRRVDILELAPSVFAPAEVLSVRQSRPDDRVDRFFSYWTLKEAYIKARGMGLSLALDGFWFELSGAAPRVQFSERCPDEAERWRFRQFAPTARHKLAVAISPPAGQEADIRLHWVVPLMLGADE